jgi:putative methionine-R-sulfoxide reductase with GAF domain
MTLLKNRIGINNSIIRRLVGDELITVCHYGYNKKEAQLQIYLGEGVTGRCAVEKNCIIINDLDIYNGQYIAGIKNAKSELCIPLISNGKFIGTFNIESTEKGNFTKDKIDLIKSLSEILLLSLVSPETEASNKLVKTLLTLKKNRESEKKEEK